MKRLLRICILSSLVLLLGVVSTKEVEAIDPIPCDPEDEGCQGGGDPPIGTLGIRFTDHENATTQPLDMTVELGDSFGIYISDGNQFSITTQEDPNNPGVCRYRYVKQPIYTVQSNSWRTQPAVSRYQGLSHLNYVYFATGYMPVTGNVSKFDGTIFNPTDTQMWSFRVWPELQGGTSARSDALPMTNSGQGSEARMRPILAERTGTFQLKGVSATKVKRTFETINPPPDDCYGEPEYYIVHEEEDDPIILRVQPYEREVEVRVVDEDGNTINPGLNWTVNHDGETYNGSNNNSVTLGTHSDGRTTSLSLGGLPAGYEDAVITHYQSGGSPSSSFSIFAPIVHPLSGSFQYQPQAYFTVELIENPEPATLKVSECASSQLPGTAYASSIITATQTYTNVALNTPKAYTFDPGATGFVARTTFRGETGYHYKTWYRYDPNGPWTPRPLTTVGGTQTTRLYLERGEWAEACVEYLPAGPAELSLTVNGVEVGMGDPMPSYQYLYPDDFPMAVSWDAENVQDGLCYLYGLGGTGSGVDESGSENEDFFTGSRTYRLECRDFNDAPVQTPNIVVVGNNTQGSTVNLSCSLDTGGTSSWLGIPHVYAQGSLEPLEVRQGDVVRFDWISSGTTACAEIPGQAGWMVGDQGWSRTPPHTSGWSRDTQNTLGTHTYGIYCTPQGGGDPVTDSCQVEVTAPPVTADISANPVGICADDEPSSSVITWTPTNADQCRIRVAGGSWQNAGTETGSFTVSPNITTTYEYACKRSDQTWQQAQQQGQTDSVEVTVTQDCSSVGTIEVIGVNPLPPSLSGEGLSGKIVYDLSGPGWAYGGQEITQAGTGGMKTYVNYIAPDIGQTEKESLLSPSRWLAWFSRVIRAASDVALIPNTLPGYDYATEYRITDAGGSVGSWQSGNTNSGTTVELSPDETVRFRVQYTRNNVAGACGFVDIKANGQNSLLVNPGDLFTITWESDYINPEPPSWPPACGSSNGCLRASGQWGGYKNRVSGSQEISVPTNAPDGTYTYTLQGFDDDGAVICEDSVDVTVDNPSGAFSLALTPGEIVLTTPTGDSTRTTISVLPKGGFGEEVTLTIEEFTLPEALQDIQFTFTDPILDSSQYSTGSKFYATVNNRIPTGVYPVEIVGTSSSTTESTTVNFTVKNITDPDITEF